MWKSITKVSIGEHKFHFCPADKLNMCQIYFIVWSERYFNGEVITSDIFTSQIYKLEKPKHESLDLEKKIYKSNSYRRIYGIPEMLKTLR